MWWKSKNETILLTNQHDDFIIRFVEKSIRWKRASALIENLKIKRHGGTYYGI